MKKPQPGRCKPFEDFLDEMISREQLDDQHDIRLSARSEFYGEHFDRLFSFQERSPQLVLRKEHKIGRGLQLLIPLRRIEIAEHLCDEYLTKNPGMDGPYL